MPYLAFHRAFASVFDPLTTLTFYLLWSHQPSHHAALIIYTIVCFLVAVTSTGQKLTTEKPRGLVFPSYRGGLVTGHRNLVLAYRCWFKLLPGIHAYAEEIRSSSNGKKSSRCFLQLQWKLSNLLFGGRSVLIRFPMQIKYALWNSILIYNPYPDTNFNSVSELYLWTFKIVAICEQA